MDPDISFAPLSPSVTIGEIRRERDLLQQEIEALRTQLSTLQTGTTTTSSDNDSSPRPTTVPAQPDHPHTATLPLQWNDVNKLCLDGLMPPNFDGRQRTDAVAFLRSIQNILLVVPLLLPQLFSIFTIKLTGIAGRWFRSNRDSFLTVDELLTGFTAEFLSDQADITLKARIQRTFQEPHETCAAHVDRVCALYSLFSDDASDLEIIQQVIISAQPDVALHLGEKTYRSLEG